MKKIASVLSIVLLVSVLLVGCKSGGMTGTWKLTGAEAYGMTMAADELSMLGLGEMSLTFKSNGTVTMNMGSVSQGNAKYKVEGDKVIITENGTSMEFTKENGALTVEAMGAKLIFTK